MTDEQIIKALECCKECNTTGSIDECCTKCPLSDYDGCCDKLIVELADFFNRKKAEIERLQRHKQDKAFCNLLGNCLVYSKNLKDYNDMRKGLKSEAIKEFAERLKKEAEIVSGGDYGFTYEIKEDDIDNIVKEMVGD